MQLNFKNVCIFWGVMDVYSVLRFIWINIQQGRIPFIDDIISFSRIYPQHDSIALILFLLSLSFIISLVASAILLFLRWRNVRWLVYCQIPLRLLFVMPSVSIMPWLLRSFHINNLILFVTLEVLSEVIKALSFMLIKKDKTKD